MISTIIMQLRTKLRKNRVQKFKIKIKILIYRKTGILKRRRKNPAVDTLICLKDFIFYSLKNNHFLLMNACSGLKQDKSIK